MPDKLPHSRLKEILRGGNLEEIVTELSSYFDFITFASNPPDENSPNFLKLEGTSRFLDETIIMKAEYVYTDYDTKWRYNQIIDLPSTIMLKLLNGKVAKVTVAVLVAEPPEEK